MNLPGRRRRCSSCDEVIVFARTVASERGPGGRLRPLNLEADPAGNVAVRTDQPDRAAPWCRQLGHDDVLDRSCEVLAMPHQATCAPKLPVPTSPPEGVVDFAAAAARLRQPKGARR